MPKVVRVSSWMRSYFTPGELSGWSDGIDVGGSLSESDLRLLKQSKVREQRSRRQRELVVEPLKVQTVLH